MVFLTRGSPRPTITTVKNPTVYRQFLHSPCNNIPSWKKNLVPSSHFIHGIWKSYSTPFPTKNMSRVFRVKLWDCKVPAIKSSHTQAVQAWSEHSIYLEHPQCPYTKKYVYLTIQMINMYTVYIYVSTTFHNLDMVYKCLRWLQLIDSRYANTCSPKSLPSWSFSTGSFRGQQVHQDVIIHLSHTLKQQTCNCSCNLPMLIQYVW